jgi:hypothetical protein
MPVLLFLSWFWCTRVLQQLVGNRLQYQRLRERPRLDVLKDGTRQLNVDRNDEDRADGEFADCVVRP